LLQFVHPSMPLPDLTSPSRYHCGWRLSPGWSDKMVRTKWYGQNGSNFYRY